MNDPVNHPKHYSETPRGIELECIEYVRRLGYSQGCAAKYAYRAGRKGDLHEDLAKCRWYIRDTIKHGTGSQSVGWDLRHTIMPGLSPRAELFDLIISGHSVAAMALMDELLKSGADLDGENQ